MNSNIYWIDGLELDDSQYSSYILKKYMVKFYGDKAVDIIKGALENNQLKELCIKLGERSFEFFNMYYMRDYFVENMHNSAVRKLAENHFKLWSIADDMINKDMYDRTVIMAPRGFAKTTVMDTALTVYVTCYRKSIYTVIIAKKDADCVSFLDTIKSVFEENEYIKDAFGELLPKKFENGVKINSMEVVFRNQTCIKCFGSGSSVRGTKYGTTRPTLVIMDDGIDQANVVTLDARDKIYNKYSEEVLNVGDKAVYRNGKKLKAATKYIFIGTALHVDDVLNRLMTRQDFHHVKFGVMKENPDELFNSGKWLECKGILFDNNIEDRYTAAKNFYEDNKEEMIFENVWPNKYDCFGDIFLEWCVNRKAFYQELQNDATQVKEKWFTSLATMPVQDIESRKFVKSILSVDPAATVEVGSDSSAFCILSKTSNNFYYVRDGGLYKLTFTDLIERIVQYLLEYRDVNTVFIEKNVYKGADVILLREKIREENRLRNRRIKIINEGSYKNKDNRISTIVSPVNNGAIIFNENMFGFIEEMTNFIGSKYSAHDDAPDCLASAYEYINEAGKGGIKFHDFSMLFGK